MQGGRTCKLEQTILQNFPAYPYPLFGLYTNHRSDNNSIVHY